MLREEVTFPPLLMDYDKMKTVHLLLLFFYSFIKSHIAIIRLLFQLLFSVDWSKPGVWFWIKSAFRSAARATWQLRSEFWQILRMHFILLPPSFISLTTPSAKIPKYPEPQIRLINNMNRITFPTPSPKLANKLHDTFRRMIGRLLSHPSSSIYFYIYLLVRNENCQFSLKMNW